MRREDKRREEREQNILYTDKFNVFGIVAFFSLRFDSSKKKRRKQKHRSSEPMIK